MDPYKATPSGSSDGHTSTASIAFSNDNEIYEPAVQLNQAPLKKKGTPRGKHVSLTIQQKLDILDEMEEGVKLKDIAAKYGVGTSTVYDIKKAKAKLQEYQSKVSVVEGTANFSKRRRLVSGRENTIEESVLDWYQQQQRVGVRIRGVELQEAAERFAKRLNVEGFKASSGWLFRFRNRHGLASRRARGEALGVDTASEEPINQGLQEMLDSTGLRTFQIYRDSRMVSTYYSSYCKMYL